MTWGNFCGLCKYHLSVKLHVGIHLPALSIQFFSASVCSTSWPTTSSQALPTPLSEVTFFEEYKINFWTPHDYFWISLKYKFRLFARCSCPLPSLFLLILSPLQKNRGTRTLSFSEGAKCFIGVEIPGYQSPRSTGFPPRFPSGGLMSGSFWGALYFSILPFFSRYCFFFCLSSRVGAILIEVEGAGSSLAQPSGCRGRSCLSNTGVKTKPHGPWHRPGSRGLWFCMFDFQRNRSSHVIYGY